MNRRRNFSGVRQLGLEVEHRVVEALNKNGFPARHAEPHEDLVLGWDVEINLYGYTVWVDLTISRDQLEKKLNRDDVRNDLVITVIVSPDWSQEKLVLETIQQVVYSLPERIKEDLLREIASGT